MKKMYLVHELNYGELLYECDSIVFGGLYDTKEKALQKAKELIELNLQDTNWILDKERNNLERDNFVRIFFREQENWGDYFEIAIQELECK